MPRMQQVDTNRFIRANPGPWKCHFCGGKITKRGNRGSDNLHVHHLINGVRDLDNLVPTHSRCHHLHHAKKCEPGCKCNRHKDYSQRRTYGKWKTIRGRRVYFYD